MKFVLCLVTAVSLVSAACANGSTQDSEHWDDLLSYIHTTQDNASSWRSHDILLYHQSFVQGEISDGSPRSHTTVSRIIVDWDRKQALTITKTIFETDDQPETLKDLKTKLSFKVLQYSSGNGSSLSIPGNRITLVKDLDLSTALSHASVHDVRWAGSRLEIEGYQRNGFDAYMRNRSIKNGQPPARVSVLHRDGELSFTYQVRNGMLQAGYVFDSNSLMTKRLTSMEKSGDLGFVPTRTVDFWWEEMNGIYIPKQMSSESMNGPKGRRFDTMQFHWFSLNEPLDSKFFDKRLLDDIGSLNKMIDPAGLGVSFD
ncbi:MAG: hypothetical protein ACK5YR_20540 [Pirellula sp.]|jgi:hypothetical protein